MTPARRWRNLPACVADLVSTMPAVRVSGCRGISLPCNPHQSAIASSQSADARPPGADADSSAASGSCHPVRGRAASLL